MFVHISKMRARKKRAKDYETFGRQVTLPALKKIEGCQEAYFFKVVESRKPEYLLVAFWRDPKALEAARTNPVYREHKRKFEAGKFCKTIPLELTCVCLDSFKGSPARKPQKAARPSKMKKTEEQPAKTPAAEAAAPTPEGA